MARWMPTVAVCVLCGTPVASQTWDPTKTPGAPRWEIGGQAGTAFFPEAFLPGAGARLTANVTERDAIELIGDAMAGFEDGGLSGLYFIQYKRMLRDRSSQRNAIFATAGLAGFYRYSHSPEHRERRPDGSTIVFSEYRSLYAEAPRLLSGGIGIERALNKYAAARADVQFMLYAPETIAGFRATAGLVFPLGGYHARMR